MYRPANSTSGPVLAIRCPRGRGACEQAGTTVHLLGPLDRSVGSFGAPVFFTLAAICATGSRAPARRMRVVVPSLRLPCSRWQPGSALSTPEVRTSRRSGRNSPSTHIARTTRARHVFHRRGCGQPRRGRQEGKLELIKGLFALCPYIAGSWPRPDLPSSTENNGILLDLHNNRGAMGYGIEQFERRNPLAWPLFASPEDVDGLVPTVISVNECDPLRDEGIEFYRLLLRSGVQARCRQVMGTIHGTEVFPVACPDISRDTGIAIASFAQG